MTKYRIKRKKPKIRLRVNFDPIKHPRDPETGKFVERPYSVPDDIGGLSTEQLVGELAASNDDFAEQVEGLAVDVPGDDDGSAVPTEIQELVDNPDAGQPGTGDYDLEGFEEGRNDALIKGDPNEGTITISTIRNTEYGPKAKLNSPFEAKEDIKDLDWEDTHRSWDGANSTWDVDAAALNDVADELAEKGWRTKITGGAREEVTATPDVSPDADVSEKLNALTAGEEAAIGFGDGEPRGPFTITERTRDGAVIEFDGQRFGEIIERGGELTFSPRSREQESQEVTEIEIQ